MNQRMTVNPADIHIFQKINKCIKIKKYKLIGKNVLINFKIL